jgi:hypothetical protein
MAKEGKREGGNEMFVGQTGFEQHAPKPVAAPAASFSPDKG